MILQFLIKFSIAITVSNDQESTIWEGNLRDSDGPPEVSNKEFMHH